MLRRGSGLCLAVRKLAGRMLSRAIERVVQLPDWPTHPL